MASLFSFIRKFALPALIVPIFLAGCHGGNQASVVQKAPDDRSALLREHGAVILKALRDTDFHAMAAYIPTQTGTRFSPYGHIDIFSDQKLTAQNLLRAAAAHTRLSWGSVIESGGATIVLSPQDFIRKYIYTSDFLNADSNAIVQNIPYNAAEQSIGNLYGGTDCIFYFKKTAAGLSSLRLFFLPREKSYQLFGIMHDGATR